MPLHARAVSVSAVGAGPLCRRPLRQSGLVRPARTPAARRTDRVRVYAEGSKQVVKKVNAAELEVEIANRSKPLIVDFYASWCGPCVMLAKELDKVADELGDAVTIVKVDCDEEEELAGQLQIRGLPTLVFISPDGEKPALRTEGLLPSDTIKEIIANEL
ncbi:unnamed protein product [Pedinophyceae sp. YPF-701]|nr:unnamed protein product [Pedinophyceae sp. YPF-701]